jgi:phosphoribosylanthranilate isomerase
VRTRIKICGITRAEDAIACVRLGVDALGFIFWKPSARHIDPATAREVIRHAGPFVSTVGVFVNPDREEVVNAINVSGVSMLQFHGEEQPQFCASFGRPFIKAFKAENGRDLLKSTQGFEAAAAWLFDSHDEQLVGGTGRRFDWDRIPAQLARPLVLSGGLDSENVSEGIRRVRPHAVDVSSGVESSKGIKDAVKVAAFIQGVHDAGS